MSYDIYLSDPLTGDRVILNEPHTLAGGTYAIGGTKEAWLNITYNYSKFYYTFIDKEKGIRALYGLTGEQAIPIIEKAVRHLGVKTSPDYWEDTPGNAGKALWDLRELCQLAPWAVIQGD